MVAVGVLNDSGLLVQQQIERVQKSVVLDLPSESREKSNQKPKRSPCAGAPNICTITQAYQGNESPTLARHQPDLVAQKATGPETIGAIGIRIIAFPRENEQNLVCEPMAVRSQSSSGNCLDTSVQPLPSGHTTCLRAQLVARLLHARLIIVFPFLVGCAGLECLIHWVRSGAR
jgi:hypothetical protein